MPVCPTCKTEYDEGISVCPECNTAFLSENLDTMMPAENMVFQKEASAPYVKKSVQYEDLHSSAVTLLSVGIGGLLLFVLDFLGVFRIPFVTGNVIFYPVMGAVFLFFIVTGVHSLKKATLVKSQIAEEEQATEGILSWFLEAYTPDSIDLACPDITEDTPQELRYFSRSEYMKKELNERFGELDDAYAEELVEQIYEKLFEHR